MRKILIVDDEKEVADMIKDFLVLNDYEVIIANSGNEAIEKVSNSPNLILLDINMPDIDGLEVCKRIRNIVTCPIIFLTARALEQDRINGLLIGADDYIIKPFSLEELEARIIAHLRREERNLKKKKVKLQEDLYIDYSSKQVHYKNELVPFTKKEFDIIELLSLNRGQIFDKERLFEIVWGYNNDSEISVVTEYIRRIRQKFKNKSGKEFIDTVWGYGYKWVE